MRRFGYCVFCAVCLNGVMAWDSIEVMENDACMALTNMPYLTSGTYTNMLTAALSSTIMPIRVNARLVLAISHYQRFYGSMDSDELPIYREHLSNAVEQTASDSSNWRYWTSRLLYAGSFAAIDEFTTSYSILTGNLSRIETQYDDTHTNALERSLLAYYELYNIGLKDAFKVLAGMSAAELGLGESATNYANQVPVPYRNTILEFIK